MTAKAASGGSGWRATNRQRAGRSRKCPPLRSKAQGVVEGVVDGALNQSGRRVDWQVGVDDTVNARIVIPGIGQRDDADVGSALLEEAASP